ncbi:MAG TPA: hypothetical protein VEY33_01805, partial [Gemmatimonadota bacterium]|nr:hypothetical protein [Gemmatimonadota bacterium]
DYFDTARLTPSVALAEGYQVYSTSSVGAVQTTMYPPMWIVSYLPVAVADSPSRVLQVGVILTLLFSFLPVALLLVSGSPSISLAVLGSTSFFLVSMLISSLSYSMLKPHADAPSLGYAMLACVLTLRTGVPTTRRVVCVGLLAWLSVLSKQVMFPILVALPLWFLLVHGRKVGARLVGWLSVIGPGLMVLMTPFFRPEGVLFNCLTIPARIPWKLGEYPRVIAVLLISAELVVHSIPLIILLTVGAVLAVAVRSPSLPSAPGLRPFLAANAWALPVLVALTTVPVSVMGRVKIGGYINTFSPTMYFLLAAGILAVIGIPERLKDRSNNVNFQSSLGLLALCSLVLALGGAAKIPFLAADFSPHEHRSQQAYNFLTRENSRAYFPMHPLAHLLADGSLFHFGAALDDREVLARLPLSTRQRKSHFPVNPSSVCWERGEESVRSRYFKEYTRQIEVRSLEPAWECYTR